MYTSETILVQVKTFPGRSVEAQRNMSSPWNSSWPQWPADNQFPHFDLGIHPNLHLPADANPNIHTNANTNFTTPCARPATRSDGGGVVGTGGLSSGVGTGVDDGSGCWSAETPDPEMVMTTAEVTILATILVTVFLCSVVANVLVCVVFSKRRSSLTLSNCFLANLTACNVLFTFLVMPFAFVSLVSRRWLFGAVMCQLTGLAVNLLVSASIFTLAVISLDRYCAVVTPLHYTMRMTRRRVWAFIAGIWLASAGVSFPPLLGWNGFKFHVNKMICTVDWANPNPAFRYYTLFLVSISFLLPLVAMLWTYSCIFRAARDNSERTRRSSIVPTVQSDGGGGGGGGGGGAGAGGGGAGGGGDNSQCTPVNKRRRSSAVPIIRRLSQTSSRSSSLLQRREESKTAVTSFLILFSFMLCWLPYFIVICIRSVAPSLPLHPVMSTISSVAAMFGCACNPLVYVFRSKGTRQDLRVILTRRRSFRNETVHSAIRRGGSMRSERGGSERGGGGGGGGGANETGGYMKGEREKGSVFWHEDMFSHGECHSIQEEGGAGDDPRNGSVGVGVAADNGGVKGGAGEDANGSGSTLHSVTGTPSMMRASPSLQHC